VFHLNYFFFDSIILSTDELQESIDEWFKKVRSNFSKLYFFNFNNKVSKHFWSWILVAVSITNTLNDYSDKSEHPELIQTVIQYINFKQLQIKVDNNKKGRIN
jgi:hypothetical protein